MYYNEFRTIKYFILDYGKIIICKGVTIASIKEILLYNMQKMAGKHNTIKGRDAPVKHIPLNNSTVTNNS